ncbi:MAG: KEOPS complex subunit Cgi121 [Halobacteria archaeon]
MKFALLCGELDIPDPDAFLRDLRALAKARGVTLQPLNADLLAGRAHVAKAFEEAEAARAAGAPFARDPGMELLLHVSGQTQIFRALEFGVKSGRNRVAVVAFPPEPGTVGVLKERYGLAEDASLAEYRLEKRRALMSKFNITAAELKAAGEERLPELAQERIALMALERGRGQKVRR